MGSAARRRAGGRRAGGRQPVNGGILAWQGMGGLAWMIFDMFSCDLYRRCLQRMSLRQARVGAVYASHLIPFSYWGCKIQSISSLQRAPSSIDILNSLKNVLEGGTEGGHDKKAM